MFKFYAAFVSWFCKADYLHWKAPVGGEVLFSSPAAILSLKPWRKFTAAARCHEIINFADRHTTAANTTHSSERTATMAGGKSPRWCMLQIIQIIWIGNKRHMLDSRFRSSWLHTMLGSITIKRPLGGSSRIERRKLDAKKRRKDSVCWCSSGHRAEKTKWWREALKTLLIDRSLLLLA